MSNLFILLLLPLLSAILLACVKNTQVAKWLSFVLAIIQMALTLPFVCNFVPNESVQFEQSFQWISSLNINFHIGIDGISLPLVMLTNTLIPIIILSTFSKNYKGNLYSLISFMQAGLLLVFMAMDAFSFYVGWEAALIPIYFICGLWGEGNGIKINLKFFIYTFFGSLLMLIAILYLSQQTVTKDFEWLSFVKADLSEGTQRWVFWAFFIAFAIKIPIFPFHTWQPDTYTNAPTAGTMLLAGIMLKMGTYGLIRWLIPVAPLGVAAYGNIALILSIIGIVYASLIAFKQYDFKRLIAYSSIAHVGLISAGIFSWNIDGVQGALMQMVNHGISVVGLFFILDIIASKTNTRDLKELGGLAARMPILAIFFLIFIMGAIGLPLTNGFIGEFLLLKGVFNVGVWYAVFAALTLVLGAVYMLRLYQKAMLGTLNQSHSEVTDVSLSEIVVLSVLGVGVIYLGICPNSLLNLSEPAVQALINGIKL